MVGFRLNTSSGRVSVGSEYGPMCTITYLDTQITCARALNSKPEYKFWFLALVRFLVQHGNLTCIFGFGLVKF